MFYTMKWDNFCLTILDQTKLPNELTYIDCWDYIRVAEAIKRLEVRGAPAIGAAAAYAMVLGWKQTMESDVDHLEEFTKIRDYLIAARPTAVNLAWAANKLYDKAVFLLENKDTTQHILSELEDLAQKIYTDDIEINKRMGRYGAEVLPNETILLTHCNAGALATCGWGTALGVVREAYNQGKIKMVYADETRPLLQGARLTAYELAADGIPVTVITDGMAAWTMKTKGINAVVVGADRIASNGDTANKIGTYGVALAAKAHNIPFYIAAPISTFDFSITTGSEIPIEERLGDEVRKFSCVTTVTDKAEIFNPSFDVTPAELISGIITEYGVIKAPYIENIERIKTKIKEDV